MTILQGDLQIKCNIYQNTSGIFHKTRTNYSKICMETKRPSIVKENFEKEKQSWRYHTPGFQIILQNCSIQNSMVLAQKQTHRSMEQSRKLRNEPTLIWSINL